MIVLGLSLRCRKHCCELVSGAVCLTLTVCLTLSPLGGHPVTATQASLAPAADETLCCGQGLGRGPSLSSEGRRRGGLRGADGVCPGDGAWCRAALRSRPSPGRRGGPARGPARVRRTRPACIYATSARFLLSQGTPAAELRPRGRGPEEEEGAPSQTRRRSVSGVPASPPRGTVGCLHPLLPLSGRVTSSARTGSGLSAPPPPSYGRRVGGQRVCLRRGGRLLERPGVPAMPCSPLTWRPAGDRVSEEPSELRGGSGPGTPGGSE